MELLKGKPVADKINEQTVAMAEKLLSQNIVPTLAILRVGNNPSDVAYEESAVKKAKTLGIHVEKYIMDIKADESDVLDVLKIINDDENIHGVLMFRPLPKGIDEEKVRNHLSAAKDVDGITDVALGGLFTGNMLGFPPCTAEAAMTILKYYGIELAGKKAVVIGRSLVVGKPVAMMLMTQNATVTVCHSRTLKEDLKSVCIDADIIICATGKMNTLTEDCVNGKQVVIDVGINFDEDGKMCGDADFEAVKNNVKAITPVPCGVGGVTTALLMHHTVAAAEAASNAL